jgi:hypothetical protein
LQFDQPSTRRGRLGRRIVRTRPSRDFIREALGLPLPEIMVSFGSLKELGLTWASSDNFNPHVTDKGNLFLQAVEP